MSQQRVVPDTGIPPDSFLETVKQCLDHLYDYAFLQRSVLGQHLERAPAAPGETRGHQVRRELLAAIEALRPDRSLPFRAPQGRPYHLATLRYVEGMTMEEAADELSISERQAYRDLRRAEENIAASLWTRRAAAEPAEPEDTANLLAAEVALLEARPATLNFEQVLSAAQAAVERLAQQQGAALNVAVTGADPRVVADPVLAQHLVTATLSHAIQQTAPGQIAVQVGPALTLSYRPRSLPPEPLTPVIRQLAEYLGWTVEQALDAEARCAIVVRMPARGRTVLVIDDNAGLVDLFESYLADDTCRLVAATSGREGLALADALVPDAIVLDVMMPEMSGWTVLQTLGSQPRTAGIPVIICSVLNDPGLAHSLGAALVVPKPVSRQALINALRAVHVL